MDNLAKSGRPSWLFRRWVCWLAWSLRYHSRRWDQVVVAVLDLALAACCKELELHRIAGLENRLRVGSLRPVLPNYWDSAGQIVAARSTVAELGLADQNLVDLNTAGWSTAERDTLGFGTVGSEKLRSALNTVELHWARSFE